MVQNSERSCGVLLHLSSLPTMEYAYSFIDFLRDGGQTWWQMLPVNPVMREGSPYKCYSAFAADSRYIGKKRINYDYSTFFDENSFWLKDYALFTSLKKYFNSRVWNQWEKEIAFRTPGAIKHYSNLLKNEIGSEYKVQYDFFCSWLALLEYAESNGVRLIGDMPLYVAHDSADVWAMPHLFKLDSQGNPVSVAGVPPDYFTEKGQLWGNPIYNWENMQKENFSWWVNRLGYLKKLFHSIRIDHFRGLESYWEVEAKQDTAVIGEWIKAPGEQMLAAVMEKYGDISLIAEDLGIITSEVAALKDRFSLPGIQVLQFDYILRNENTFFYSGTHDNDTLLGWYKDNKRSNPYLVQEMLNIMGIDFSLEDMEIIWRIIVYIYKSPANTVIIPMQDLLGLDSEARMNIPGIAEGNWGWKLEPGCLKLRLSDKLKKLSADSGRCCASQVRV